MKKNIFLILLYITLLLSMVVVGFGFGELIQLTDIKLIKLLLLIISIFCGLYWPYCIFMKTNDFFDEIIKKDEQQKEWKRKNRS